MRVLFTASEDSKTGKHANYDLPHTVSLDTSIVINLKGIRVETSLSNIV